MSDEDKDEETKNAETKHNRKGRVFNFVALGKDSVALLRDLAVFVLAVLLLIFPRAFNSLLVDAGFEEGSIVGFKWKSKLVDSDAALKEAQTTITGLREQLNDMSNVLAEAQTKSNDPALKEKISKLQKENVKLNDATSRTEASVQTTIAANAPLVDKVQSTTRWGIVFSADTDLDKAKYEVETIAPKLGIPNASTYFRQGYYRSVSVVDDRSQAEQILFRAKNRRADAYIVNMSTWCPRINEKEGYRECVSP